MDTSRPAPVAALVALKAGAEVKSRLGAALTVPLRQELAWAMALDTLRALAVEVELLLVITDRTDVPAALSQAGLTAEVLPEGPRIGMNEALRHGDHDVRSRGFETVLACVGDLPALRSADVAALLDLDHDAGRVFVPDRSGIGTTMLLARGEDLNPCYQGESAVRHRRSGAVSALDLGARLGPGTRQDVDTAADLAAAVGLGLGPATAALVEASDDLRRLLSG